MSARRDRIMPRIIPSVLLFAALLAFTLFAFTQQRAKRIAAQPGWALTAIEDVDIPPATAAQARGILARRPLNQPVLNLLFAVESRGDLDPARRETFIDTIKALGWRDTPSQQNLIVETLRDGDPREAVMRADALLRRGKLRSEEHTSELQSLMRISYAVFRLKKKNNKTHP